MLVAVFYREIATAEEAISGGSKPFVMIISDDEDDDDDVDDDESVEEVIDGRSLVTGTRFACDDLDLR